MLRSKRAIGGHAPDTGAHLKSLKPQLEPKLQGLGAELARAFAAHGARLILSARRREQLQV